MMINRSMPPSVLIPELPYPDVREAVDWLRRSFGFVERLRIGDHRSQLLLGVGSIIITKRDGNVGTSSLLVRVDNVDSHYEHAKESGAQIVNPPTDYPYGERQYTAVDIGGHRWTFSQTVADVDPSSWGGTLLVDKAY
jgi:uncharacterized glyoxalase superfamily protein PhnB